MGCVVPVRRYTTQNTYVNVAALLHMHTRHATVQNVLVRARYGMWTSAFYDSNNLSDYWYAFNAMISMRWR